MISYPVGMVENKVMMFLIWVKGSASAIGSK